MQNMKFYSMRPTYFFAILIVAVCGITASAQSNSYANMLNVTMTASQNLFNAQMNVNQARSNMAAAAGQSSSAPAHNATAPYQRPPVRAFPITATDFQALSAPIMPQQFANSAQGVDPQTRQQMRQLFDQFLTSFGNQARRNNMANAFAFICGVSLMVKNGRSPNNAETNQLIAYFNNNLAVSPDYAVLDPQKQQMLYESLIITGGIISFLDGQGKQTNNPQLRSQAMEMSKQVLRNFLGINN